MIRWDGKLTGVAIAAALVVGLAAPARAHSDDGAKLDKILAGRAGKPGKSRVIIIVKPGADAGDEVHKLGGKMGRRLRLIHGHAIELPNSAIRELARRSEILSMHYDRPTGGEMNRVAVTVGARAVQNDLGFDGAGIGVAVIDSGITSFHNDLTYGGVSTLVKTLADQRSAAFVDFVNGRLTRYDDNGHGTHVAGIIGGNGFDSAGSRAGIAPAAHLVGLKVLDQNGRGVISNVIAALDWVLQNRTTHNIRVVNLSVGAAVTESYRTDPLAQAAKRVVESGVVVVTAAGNLGKNAAGQPLYGGITAPGNAPWVLTVGAFNHQGTVTRSDDVMALYSSRGPTAVDYSAKPDLVAPGTGVVSLADPTSLMYFTKSEYLLKGSLSSTTKPYLSLTGTSMAAPVVAGTVALMMQANPSLTPNMVKAILQYTSLEHAGYSGLTQGAGFVNTRGAVILSQFFHTAQAGSQLTMPSWWRKKINWGNHRLSGGVIRPNVNAFQRDTVWGAATDGEGDNIVWGTLRDDDNIVWGTFDALGEDNIVWGTITDADGDNIVWGTYRNDDSIVWGTAADDNIVWGTDCGGADCDNIVWGTVIDENIVWGTASADDNIVWGTADDDDNIVWGTADDDDNIVWGTVGDVDNIVWRTVAEADNITWGNSGEDTPLFDDPDGAPANFDATVWESVFSSDPILVGSTSSEVVTSAPLLEPATLTITATGLLAGGL